jgi:DNA-binding response OmpR family regulator
VGQERPEQNRAIALRQMLMTYFNDSELRDLCFDMNINYEDLLGQARSDKVREFIGYVQRHGRINELMKRCQHLRPLADWQAIEQTMTGTAEPKISSAVPSESSLRVLIVEDLEEWQLSLQETLIELGEHVLVDIAENYTIFSQYIANNAYDLVTIDLSLDPRTPELLGMDILRELRASRYNKESCGLIVLTANPSLANMRLALRDYQVADFIDKSEFDNVSFLETARAAIRNARLHQATVRAKARYHLTITYSQDRILTSDLIGPNLQRSYSVRRRVQLKMSDLVRDADELNILLSEGDSEAWRDRAAVIGNSLHQLLAKDPQVINNITMARALAQPPADIWLQFSGPPHGLELPFELLRDGDDHVALLHILTRRLTSSDTTFLRNIGPFHTFIEDLLKNNNILRVLVVGSDGNGAVPAAITEAQTISAQIEADLTMLGIPHMIVTLVGEQANYISVGQELRSGRYHIFHYAGYSHASDEPSQSSGLTLRDGLGTRSLTAESLNLLVQDKGLQMMYLSCGLGARTLAQIGRGDFHSTLEALARAGVPIVLGYRWMVADKPAGELAQHFYQALWRTFSPGAALLEARRAIALGPYGRDDETWAAPVLLMQNG